MPRILSRVAPNGCLDRSERFTCRILHAFGLMAARAGDRSGQALDVLAQNSQMLGDLLDLLAQRMVGWHFGVFGGHRSLPSLIVRFETAGR